MLDRIHALGLVLLALGLSVQLFATAPGLALGLLAIGATLALGSHSAGVHGPEDGEP